MLTVPKRAKQCLSFLCFIFIFVLFFLDLTYSFLFHFEPVPLLPD